MHFLVRKADIRMSRCVRIHGHSAQPPRGHPWLAETEFDEPEEITVECYSPASAACRLEVSGQMIDVVCHDAKVGFTFGQHRS